LPIILNKDQSAISQLERRTDMYVRTLADFVKALGGELEIRGNFTGGSIRITGIADRHQVAAGTFRRGLEVLPDWFVPGHCRDMPTSHSCGSRARRLTGRIGALGTLPTSGLPGSVAGRRPLSEWPTIRSERRIAIFTVSS